MTETYFGTEVVDDYRYMETKDDPVAVPWIRSEGRYTRALFDGVAPRAEVAKAIAASTGSYTATRDYRRFGAREFWIERAAGSDNFDVMVREGGATRKLIDIAALRAARGGAPMAINYYMPSPNGSRVAVGISEGGSERAVLTVYDAATGKAASPALERVQWGPPIWSSDGRLLYLNRLAEPPAGAPPSARYLNSSAVAWDMKGEPAELFGGAVREAVIPVRPEQAAVVNVVPGASTLHGLVINGVQNEAELWLAPTGTALTLTTPWKKAFSYDAGITWIEQRERTLYLLSHKDAPTFQVLALEAGQPLSTAKTLVKAEPGRLIETIRAASDGLYVIAREGLHSRLFRVGPSGTLEPIALPAKGSIDGSSSFSDPTKPGITVLFDNWATPPTWLRFDPAKRVMASVGIGSVPVSFDPKRYVVSDLTATARDGVKVPLSVVRAAGHSRPGPLLLNAYGSYGVSNFPYFSPRTTALVDQGIDFAMCHVRGGGELGEAWRLGGKDANKSNTWRDLIACAETAIAQGLTTPDQLFITGGSAGGIPMGMAPMERPDLFAGVIDQVPMASALRAEYQTNGPANIVEFGTVKDAQGFRNLLAMDGYQHVKTGVAYPPYLITTGLNDPRVDSWQPGKLAAKMRAANPKNVVLLRVDEDGGHGIGSTKAQTDSLYADIVTFINWRLGKPGWTLAY
ncbi:prolyl oligopeptidase family serine peptidase [Sphingomonas floccifaciens]|uniref:prolyl oligopeptidase family serine peptidase n=1 Tax=Sphingomonas floccifaciens TaxID=1844115 RepID=UPI0036D388F3